MDPHSLYADLDPAVFLNADPDPAVFLNADPDTHPGWSRSSLTKFEEKAHEKFS